MLSWIDVCVVVAYLLLILVIGLTSRFWAPKQAEGIELQTNDASQDTVGDGSGSASASVSNYFLAGRSVAWWAVGMTLFTSNIGSEHFIGLAGSGAASGIAVGYFEINAPFLILFLGAVLVPFYLDSKVFTMPEFLEKRYNSHCRTWLALVSVLVYIFTKISVSLYAGSLILKVFMGLESDYVSAAILLVATGAYTVVGGLTAVVYTEVVQTVILLVGATILLMMGLWEVGGPSGLADKVPPYYMHIFRSSSDRKFPWTGLLLGYPIIAFWYWCTDQVIVQRVLAAKNVKTARRGTILAGYLKLSPLFFLVVPGMIARALYPDDIKNDPNSAYPLLVTRLLPQGLIGLLLAAMLAALMSSFASIFNSCSTIFTMDVYLKLRPAASARELLLTGRIATGVMMGLGLLWIPVLGAFTSELYVYLQSVQGYLSPPITAVFLLGLFWKGSNHYGAMTCLILGTILGMSRLLLELMFGNPDDVEGIERESTASAPHSDNWFMNIYVFSNFLHFTFGLFVTCVTVLVVVSAITNKWMNLQLTREQEELTWKYKDTQSHIRHFFDRVGVLWGREPESLAAEFDYANLGNENAKTVGAIEMRELKTEDHNGDNITTSLGEQQEKMIERGEKDGEEDDDDKMMYVVSMDEDDATTVDGEGTTTTFADSSGVVENGGADIYEESNWWDKLEKKVAPWADCITLSLAFILIGIILSIELIFA